MRWAAAVLAAAVCVSASAAPGAGTGVYRVATVPAPVMDLKEDVQLPVNPSRPLTTAEAKDFAEGIERKPQDEDYGRFSHLAIDEDEEEMGGCLSFMSCLFSNDRKARVRRLNMELWAAADQGDTSACTTLIKMGAEIESQSVDDSSNPKFGFTRLYGFHHIEERDQAMALGIDPKAPKKPQNKPPKREGSGRTALRWAAWKGHAETVAELLRLGASADAVDPDGWSALHEACIYGHKEVVEVLLAAGANMDQATNTNWRPMHLAASYGHQDVVTLLHDAGANMCHTTDGGLTAMDWAKAYGWTDTAAYLRDAPGARSGGCKTCGRSNFFVTGGIQSVISTM